MLNTILALLAEMAPYLLLGFFFAGLLHAFVPQQLYARHLSAPTMGSVIKAALLGVPLPLCSCGVLPTTVGLRRKGASDGASVAFLISTPQTGVDSILATYSLLGPVMCVIRPVVAFITALFGGAVTNLMQKECNVTDISDVPTSNERPSSFTKRCLDAIRYAYVEMMADVGKWLVVGFVVAALITVLVPQEWLSVFATYPVLSYLLVLAIAIPMYVCATGSIPIAVSLMMKGLSPGAALVFLMAGPATNAASMLVVSKVFGRRTTLAYIISIIGGAVVAASVIDYVLPASWFVLPQAMHSAACCESHSPSWFQIVCSIALLLMLANTLLLHRHHHQKENPATESQGSEEASSTIFCVKGMNCSHCQAAVRDAIASVEGVTSVEVSLADGKAFVAGGSEEEIMKAVSDLGYDIHLDKNPN